MSWIRKLKQKLIGKEKGKVEEGLEEEGKEIKDLYSKLMEIYTKLDKHHSFLKEEHHNKGLRVLAEHIQNVPTRDWFRSNEFRVNLSKQTIQKIEDLLEETKKVKKKGLPKDIAKKMEMIKSKASEASKNYYRDKILNLLAGEKMYFSQLVEETNASKRTVSKWLKRLKKEGKIESEKVGKYKFYKLK